MLITEKVLEKEFEGKNNKHAYLEACKWIAGNIIAINNSENLSYQIQKVKTENVGKVVVRVFITADEKEIMERHCNICREVGGMFYMAEQKHKCESCKMLPYRRRMEQKLKAVKESMKGSIL